MRDWNKKIVPRLKDFAKKQAKAEPDGKILTKNLWYAIVGSLGIRDTKSDYTLFKRVIVRERRRDLEFNSIFKDEDRYRGFEFDAKWKNQRERVIIVSEKKTCQSFIVWIANYFHCGRVVTRGSISETVLAEMREHIDDHTIILHLGDCNAKGREIYENLQHEFKRAEFIAVTPLQARKFNLPKQVTKERGSRKDIVELWKRNRWPNAELDAFIARYREVAKVLVVAAIMRHLDGERWTRDTLEDAASIAASETIHKTFAAYPEPPALVRLRETLNAVDLHLMRLRGDFQRKWSKRYVETINRKTILSELPKLSRLERQLFHESDDTRRKLLADVKRALQKKYQDILKGDENK